MAYSYNIYTKHGMAVLSCTGDLRLEDLRQGVGQLCHHPEFNKIDKMLTDLSPYTDLEISAEEIERQAIQVAAGLRSKFLKVAIVAPHDLVFGVSRMFTSFANHDAIGVFRNKHDACSWLKVRDCDI